jgi:Uma2 family endonuclease
MIAWPSPCRNLRPLGGDILVPDLGGWRRERMPVYPDTAYCELPQDWVCEIVSPSTGRLDRVLKMPKYATNGLAHLWLTSPVLKTLEGYRLENARWLLLADHGEDEIVRVDVFLDEVGELVTCKGFDIFPGAQRVRETYCLMEQRCLQ